MPLPTLLALALACQPPADPKPVAGARAPVPAGCTCSANLRWVSVRVRRADGTPVTDAAIRVRDARTGRAIATGGQPPMLAASGEYIAVRDGDVRPRPDAPIAVVVEAEWHGQRRSATLRVGTPDACGCHLQRVGEPTTLVFP